MVPKAACWSVQVDLPSAPLELTVKPDGRVIVVPRISEGEGTVGLSCWGKERSTSIPEGLSAESVVGLAAREGLKLSWSQPVVGG